MKELKRCPFCGGEASSKGVVRYASGHEAWFEDGQRVLVAYYVNCMFCGITNKGMLGHQSEAIAIEKWNTRAINREEL